MDDDDFFTPYILDIIPNSLVGQFCFKQANNNLWIISINGEYTINAIGEFDKLQRYQNQSGNYTVRIRLWRRKIYKLT